MIYIIGEINYIIMEKHFNIFRNNNKLKIKDI